MVTGRPPVVIADVIVAVATLVVEKEYTRYIYGLLLFPDLHCDRRGNLSWKGDLTTQIKQYIHTNA